MFSLQIDRSRRQRVGNILTTLSVTPARLADRRSIDRRLSARVKDPSLCLDVE